jgi:hypothetical protein
MKATVFKEDIQKPYRQGEELACLTVREVEGQNARITVNDCIWVLKDHLQSIHKCTLIVKISED